MWSCYLWNGQRSMGVFATRYQMVIKCHTLVTRLQFGTGWGIKHKVAEGRGIRLDSTFTVRGRWVSYLCCIKLTFGWLYSKKNPKPTCRILFICTIKIQWSPMNPQAQRILKNNMCTKLESLNIWITKLFFYMKN